MTLIGGGDIELERVVIQRRGQTNVSRVTSHGHWQASSSSSRVDER